MINWVDYLLAAVLAFLVISGFSAGLPGWERTAAAIIGVFAGFWCYGIAGAYVLDYVNSRTLANFLGF